jgi:hypothetical protein
VTCSDLETILYEDLHPKKLSLFQRMEWAKQSAEGLAWLHGGEMGVVVVVVVCCCCCCVLLLLLFLTVLLQLE